MTALVLVLLALGPAALEAALAVLGRERLRGAESDRGQRLAALLARREALHWMLRAVVWICLALAALHVERAWAVPVLVGAELAARLLGARLPRRTAAGLWRVGDGLWRLGRPATRWLVAEHENDEDDEQAEEAVLEVAEAAPLPTERRQRIAGILDFSNQTVDGVMTARMDMVCIDAAATVAEAGQRVLESGRSRLVVTGDSADDVQGVVHARDLLRPADRATPVYTVARPALFLADTASLGLALRQLRGSHSSIAVVVDEYGGTAGLVTIEDLVEEIFGEIEDESDPPEAPLLRPRAEGGWWANGRLELADLWPELGLDAVDTGDCQTVGGLAFALAGDLPVVGEALCLDSGEQRLWLLVTAMEGRRVAELAVKVAASGAVGEGDPDDAEPTNEAQPWPGSLSLSTVETRLGYDEALGGTVPSAELFAFWPAGDLVGRQVVWRRHAAQVHSEGEGGLLLTWTSAANQTDD